MAKLDSAKEELGWLKVLFAILAAGDASLIAWFFQSYEAGRTEWLAIAGIAIAEITAAEFWINFTVYRRIAELERL